MIREVLYTTGITATSGIGSNLYLAKLAMDITAKHAAPDKDGVRIAELNEESFRYLLWDHKPLTDFWQVGPGTVRRLEKQHGAAVGKAWHPHHGRAGPRQPLQRRYAVPGVRGGRGNFDRPRLGHRALWHEGDQRLPPRVEQHLRGAGAVLPLRL